MSTHRSRRVALLVLLAALPAHAVLCAPPAAERVSSATSTEHYRLWRAEAAQRLVERGDPESLAAAAALSFVGSPGRLKNDFAASHAGALDLAAAACDHAPENAAIAWLRLELCAEMTGCDIRDPAMTLRWLDADNGAAWMPSLAVAQREKNATDVDRILTDMAQGLRFDLYWNRIVVLLFDALRRVAPELPPSYVPSDLARYNEAISVASAEVLPPFAPLSGACRESAALERRESCLRIARVMQRGDTVIAQLAGFGIEKHWTVPDSREARVLGEQRRVLVWRSSTASQADEPLLPWLKSAWMRRRIALMRAHAREEDVDLAILREHRLPLEPPEEFR